MTKLNSYFKLALACAASLLLMPALTSCSDDDDNSDADPVVRYVRPTKASAADSLLGGAYLGDVIAIIGENLENVKSIYFNDKQADLSMPFITSNSIVVQVPSDIPELITNIMYVEAKNGNIIEYPFEALIKKPLVTGLDLSGLKDRIVYIEGNYFVNTDEQPVEVTFAPNLPADVLVGESTNSRLAVVLPEGAEEGNLTISTVYGTSIAQFSRSRVIFEGESDLSWEHINGAYCSLASAKKMLISFAGTFEWWVGIRMRSADDTDLWASPLSAQIDWGPDDSTCGGVYVGEVSEEYLSCISGTDWYICGGTNGSCKITKIELIY